jgi:hypothetical protein
MARQRVQAWTPPAAEATICIWVGRKQKRVQRFGEGGQRERYFADDDRADLATLVKRQKHAGEAFEHNECRDLEQMYLTSRECWHRQQTQRILLSYSAGICFEPVRLEAITLRCFSSAVQHATSHQQ